MKVLIKKIFNYAIYGILSFVLLVLTLFLLIQTETFKDRGISLILDKVNNGSDVIVSVEELRGFIPFNMTVKQVNVSDKKGKCIGVEGLRLKLEVIPLFYGRVVVDDAGADSVDIARIPELPHSPEEPEKESSFTISQIKNIFKGQVPLEIKNFSIENISFKPEGAVDSLDFLVRVKVLSKEGISDDLYSSILIKQKVPDGKKGNQVSLSIKGKEPLIVFNIDLHEPKDGNIARIFDLGKYGDLSAVVDGNGFIENFNLNLDVSASNIGTLNGKVAVNMVDGETDNIAFENDLLIKITPNLANTLFKNPTQKELSLALSGTKSLNVLNINKFSIGIGDNTFMNISGSYGLNSQDIKGRYVLKVKKLSLFEKLTGHSLAGALSISGTVSGTPKTPDVFLKLSMNGFKYEDYLVKNLALDFNVDSVKSDIKFTSKAKVLGINSPVFNEKQLDFILDGVFSNKKKIVKINQLDLKGKVFNIRLLGDANLSTHDFSVGKDSFLKISDLKSLLKTPSFNGKSETNLNITGNYSTLNINVSLESLLKDITGLPGDAVPFVGKSIILAVNANVKDDGNVITLKNLDLKTKAIDLGVKGNVNIRTKDLKAKLSLNAPKLPSVLSQTKRETGSFSLNASVDGKLDSFRTNASLKGKNITFKGKKDFIKDVNLTFKAKNLPSKAIGNLKFDLHAMGRKLDIGTEFKYFLDGTSLTLNKLHLVLGKNKIKGNLSVDLKTSAINGKIKARLTDLSTFNTFLANQKLSGNLELDADLKNKGKKQSVILHSTGKNIKSDVASVESMKLDGSLSDVLNSKNLSGSLDLTIEGIKTPSAEISLLNLSGRGSGKKWHISSSLKSHVKEPLSLKTKAVLELSKNNYTLMVIDGKWGGYPFLLKKPFTFKSRTDGFEFSKLILSIKKGIIEAKGGISKKRCNISTKITNFPIEIVSFFVQTPHLNGKLNGNMEIVGKSSQPRGKVSIGIKNFYIEDLKQLPLDLSLNSSFNSKTLDVDLKISGFDKTPQEVQVKLPVGISIDPFNVKVNESAPVDGRLSLYLNLKRLMKLFPVDGLLVEGFLKAKANVKGSIKEPRISGEINMDRGSVENLSTATVLKDVDLKVAVESGNKLKITRLRATDGQKGIIIGKGFVDISSGLEYKVNMDFQEANLLRLDMASVTLDGELSVEGSKDGGVVSGNVIVDPVEINIPSGLPPSVTTIDVTEAGKEENKKVKKSEKGSKSNIKLALTISIPKRFYVRGQGLDSQWEGKLEIGGFAHKPEIVGDINIVSGSLDFLDRQFTFKNGQIVLNGAFPPSPFIDIVTESKLKDITAIVKIKGTTSKFDLKLESDPYLPQDEVLAYILFGKRQGKLSGLQAIQLAYALKSLYSGGGGSSLDVISKTRKLLGLDQLQFKQADGTEESSKIGATKYIGDKVYIGVEQGIGNSSKGSVSVGIDITDSIVVESELDSSSSGEVGVYYKYDY